MTVTISNKIKIVIGSWGSYNVCNSRALYKVLTLFSFFQRVFTQNILHYLILDKSIIVALIIANVFFIVFAPHY